MVINGRSRHFGSTKESAGIVWLFGVFLSLWHSVLQNLKVISRETEWREEYVCTFGGKIYFIHNAIA